MFEVNNKIKTVKENTRIFIRRKRGVSLVEVVVASSIIMIILVSLVSTHSMYLRLVFSNSNVVKAAFMLEESVEVLKFMRQVGWDAHIKPLATSTPYYFEFDGGLWKATTTPVFLDGFERTFVVSDVRRSATGAIATAGTYDPRTKLITMSVEWFSQGSAVTRSFSTYLIDIYGN